MDATNVIEAPEASVICRIGLDHTDLLGDTLAAIAGEKAGIVKARAPVVSWPQESEAMAVIEAVAAERGCELFRARLRRLVRGAARGSGSAPVLVEGEGIRDASARQLPAFQRGAGPDGGRRAARARVGHLRRGRFRGHRLRPLARPF